MLKLGIFKLGLCCSFHSLEGLRSCSVEPASTNGTTRYPVTTTPVLSRYKPRQSSLLQPESDYETQEKIMQRAQRIRRAESARLCSPSPRYINRSHSNASHFQQTDLKVTPKATPTLHNEILRKHEFVARRRPAHVRMELKAPHCQRKRIRSVKEAEDAEAKPRTLAEIVRQKAGVSLETSRNLIYEVTHYDVNTVAIKKGSKQSL